MSRARSHVRPRISPWLIVSALLPLMGVGVDVSADNPRLTLKLENVSLADAVQRLSQDSGVSVTTWALPDGPQPPELLEKVNFDWRGVPFSRAFRQLCEKFHLQPMRQPGGYQLYPGAPPVPKALKAVGFFQAQGVKMSARQILVSATPRALNFTGEEFDGGDGNLQLTVGCELADLDADRVAGLRNVTARDDKGTILTFGPEAEASGDYNPSAYPDEWITSVGLPEPHPAARKLVAVEGDLMIYKRFQHHRAEIPLPLTAKSVEKKVGLLSLLVSDYVPERRQPVAQDRGPVGGPAGENPGEQQGAQLKVRVYYPAGLENGVLNQWSQPLLRTTSGRIVTAGWEGSGGQQEGEGAYMDLRIRFQPSSEVPGGKDAPAALLWTFLERSEPIRLFHFRMADIPLPAPRPWKAPVVPRPVVPAPEVPPTPAHPFYDEAGGTLISQVEVAGRKSMAGRVTLGLSPVADGAVGPVRWLELDADDAGVVRVPSLRPGKYRLQRRFRPAEGDLPAAGRWTQEDISVEVTARQSTTAAPLRWTTEPASKPTAKPAPKPAAKPVAGARRL